jgi:hypothetical protein
VVKISLTGFLLDYSGYGEATRRLLAALDAVQADVTIGQVLSDGNGQLPPDEMAAKYLARPKQSADVSLVVAAPDQFPMIAAPAPRRVGFTNWETDRLHPRAHRGCAGLDLVLVPSQQNVEVFAAAKLPVRAVPYPVMPPVAAEPLDIPDRPFVFYGVLSWQERKNPRGLLIAYLTGFTAEDRVLLVLKIAGHAGYVAAGRELTVLRETLNLPNPPKVRLIGGRWNEVQMASLHERGDCYVTLTRGEACHLPALEAVARGTTVIATDWGGHTDFLRGNPNAVLIPSRMVPVVQAYPYFDGTQCWADPDILAARAAMRAAYENGFVEKNPSDLSSRSLAAVGAQLVEALRGD